MYDRSCDTVSRDQVVVTSRRDTQFPRVHVNIREAKREIVSPRTRPIFPFSLKSPLSASINSKPVLNVYVLVCVSQHFIVLRDRGNDRCEHSVWSQTDKNIEIMYGVVYLIKKDDFAIIVLKNIVKYYYYY